MDRKNIAFLVVGVLFGFVVGLFLSYAIFIQEDIAFSSKKDQSNKIQGMQQPPEHIDILEEIHSLKKLLQEDPSNYQALVRLGNLYFDAAKFDQALEYYRNAIEINDSDPNVVADLGICYRNTGKPEKAIEYFEKAYSRNNSHWQALFNIIIVATNDLSDYETAEDAMLRLEKIKPDVKGLDLYRDKIEEMKKQK